MEERQEEQEDSAIGRATADPPQGLPPGSPDVVNLGSASPPADHVARIAEPSPRHPETLTASKSRKNAKRTIKSTHRKPRRETEKNVIGPEVSTNGSQDQVIFMQDPTSDFAGAERAVETAIKAQSSPARSPENPGGPENQENVASPLEPGEKKVRGYRANEDQSELGLDEIVPFNESLDDILGSSSTSQDTKSGKTLKPRVEGKPEVTTPSVEELATSLDVGLSDPGTADHVDVIFSRDTPSELAGGSAGSVVEASSTRRDASLWRVASGRICRGLRICNWFPKMCSCLDGGSPMAGNCSTGRTGSYERLGSGPTLFEFSSMVQKARRRAANKSDESVDNERQAELTFYNNDLTWTRVCVEKNLRTMDLCELLKVKRNATGNAWSIVETWPELGIERTLEDHEDILATHREMEMFASHHERKFYFRKDFLKYEFFVSPKQFFPAEMVAFPNDEDRGTSGDVEETLRSYLARNDAECPQVFSVVWLRDESSSTWKKTYMLLQGRKLYTTRKAFFPSAKFLRSRLGSPKASLSSKSNCSHHRSMSSPDRTSGSPSSPSSSSTTSRTSDRFHHSNAGALPKRTPDHDQPSPLAHLSDYYVYKIPNAKRYFNAPFEWGACLRPSSNAEAEDTEAGVPGLKVIAFTSEKSRACWLTAMRLAKYGKQLRENYRAFRNKQCEQNGGGSPKEQYSSYNVPNESLRSRVAMDFTGSVGRIVEDPKEAKDIAESEGIIWRRRWRPFSRPPPGCAMVRLHGLDGGIHVLQPWFHSGLNRDIAAAIIKEHGSVDGVFLVRESKSNPGAYVLTYKYSEKVFHAQIQPIFDERRNCWLYTLDKGATKFYDLLQLIEFYQLNSGSLPTRLTHYVQNGVTVAQQRQEDGGASPSPPFTGNQNMSPKSDCPKGSSGI